MRQEQQSNRFKGAAWFPENEERVIIGGSGGIGSWLGLYLARAGFMPMIYDFDRVEEHNLGGQLFTQGDIGTLKVTALQQILQKFTGDNVDVFNEEFTLESPSHHFMFSAFDNMAARKTMFNVWKRSIDSCAVTPLFIDGRLEMEQLQIFCVTPETMDKYEREHLFDDSEVEDTECTVRQTTHTAAMIATLMTAFFTNHIANIYTRERLRSVPFYYEFFTPGVFTNLEME